MSSCNNFPHIIGIRKTKLNKNSRIDLISLENYDLHFVNSETISVRVLVCIKKQYYIQ